MEHYDGPAFYRKFPVKPTPNRPEDPLTEQAEAQVKQRQRHNQKNTAKQSPNHVTPQKSATVAQPTSKTTSSRPFQVTAVPKQLHWSHSVEDQRQRRQGLLARLHKSDASFLLFQTEPVSHHDGSAAPLAATATLVADYPHTGLSNPEVDSAKNTAVVPDESLNRSTEPVQSEPAPTEVFYPESMGADSLTSASDGPARSNGHLHAAVSDQAVSDRSQTSEPAKVDQPTSMTVDYLPVGTVVTASSTAATAADMAEPESASVAANTMADAGESADNSSLTAEISDGGGEPASAVAAMDPDVERLLARTTTATSQPDSAEEPTEQTNVTETKPVTPPNETTSKKAKPMRGLGHSLGDIMQEEGNEQRNLALFADKGSATPAAQPTQAGRGYHFPALQLLPKPVVVDDAALDEWIEHQAEVLDATLSAFHVDAHVTDWTVGPTVTQFQIKLALGVKVNKITNLNDDLKLALAAKDIRIEAPIPGKTTVGIEIPNLKSRPVMLAEVLNSPAFKNSDSPLTVALGVDLFGKPQVTDLRKMPHGLIAGATGSGKSVFINSLLLSILYKATPQQVKLLLIDPKAVEMAPYDGLPHLLAPVISDPKAAAAALKWVVTEMDQRYEKLAAAGVRNIEQFNDRADANDEPALKMPYIVIIIDELADLMMMAASEVQDYIVRITQKARAAGIHLLVATQRPSVDIVTGTIKNNIPTRIAFMVSSQIDSRTILDTTGAESLLGRGDMLYLGNGASQPVRLQGAFVEDEVDKVTDFVRTQGQPQYAFEPNGLLQKETNAENQDELLPAVLSYIAAEKTVSTSKLQRVFSIGYNRAANLIDDLEQHQYVSPQRGSKPREVYLTTEDLDKDLPEPHDPSAPFSS